MDVKIEDSWKNALHKEFTKPYFLQIATHLKTERATKAVIYPPGSLIFNAFEHTPFDKVKDSFAPRLLWMRWIFFLC